MFQKSNYQIQYNCKINNVPSDAKASSLPTTSAAPGWSTRVFVAISISRASIDTSAMSSSCAVGIGQHDTKYMTRLALISSYLPRATLSNVLMMNQT